ncbi:MAG: hypothetical protein ACQESR_14125 [Planctomycetota bacterium]
MALSLLGSCHQCAGKAAEAIDVLEKAMALRRSGGFTDKEVDDADDLGRLYYQFALQLMKERRVSDAQSQISKLDDLIARYADADGFQRQNHENSLSSAKKWLQEVATSAPDQPASAAGSAKAAASAEADKIRFKCAGCDRVLNVPVDRAGKTGKCPSCATALQIPQAADHYNEGNLMAVCAALGKAYELREQGESERADKGFELAENWLREVLQTPCLPLVIEAEANCLLGTCLRLGGRLAEAKPVLEKGLALKRSTGFLVNEELFYADDLGRVYDRLVQSLITEGHFEQAKALLAQVEGFISQYKSLENFDRVRHEGFVLMGRGFLAAHERRLDEAIHFFKQVLKPPFKEYFASDETVGFVLERACHNIGRIYFLSFYRVTEAIPYFQEALRYCNSGDEDYQTNFALLEEAKSQAAVSQSRVGKLV